MNSAKTLASSRGAAVNAEHVAYAFATRSGEHSIAADAIISYGKSLGWDSPAMPRRWWKGGIGGAGGSLDPALQREVENTAKGGIVTIPALLLRLYQRGGLDHIAAIVTEAGGDLESWLVEHG